MLSVVVFLQAQSSSIFVTQNSLRVQYSKHHFRCLCNLKTTLMSWLLAYSEETEPGEHHQEWVNQQEGVLSPPHSSGRSSDSGDFLFPILRF